MIFDDTDHLNLAIQPFNEKLEISEHFEAVLSGAASLFLGGNHAIPIKTTAARDIRAVPHIPKIYSITFRRYKYPSEW